MVRVKLPENLARYAGGEFEFELAAANMLQVLEQLGARHPELAPHLEQGVAFAVDGVIYQDALLQPLPATGELFLIERITGG